MRVLRFLPLLLVGIVSTVTPAAGQGQPFYSHDNHTEYDLLDPATHQFAIVYFLTERRVGRDCRAEPDAFRQRGL